MKKIVGGLSLALATAAVGFAATTAYADNTDVEFNVEPTYTVTIPPKVTLEKTESGIYSKTEPIVAEDVLLRENQGLFVMVSSKSRFNMKTPKLFSSYKLPYTVSGKYGPVKTKTLGGLVATFGTSTKKQKAPITYKTDEVPKYAGAFSDTVVFTLTLAELP